LININSYLLELQLISTELTVIEISTGSSPSSSSSATFTKALQVGSRDPEVTALQTKLTTLGFYNGPITGYFGELTKAAVVSFQRAKGLEPVGSVGPLTRGELNK
jgi:peptidoglycan hydrolase-like protein with peptidoglycan-binding domain